MRIKTTTLNPPAKTEDPRITQALGKSVGSALVVVNAAGSIEVAYLRTGTNEWSSTAHHRAHPYPTRERMVERLTSDIARGRTIVTVETEEDFEL